MVHVEEIRGRLMVMALKLRRAQRPVVTPLESWRLRMSMPATELIRPLVDRLLKTPALRLAIVAGMRAILKLPAVLLLTLPRPRPALQLVAVAGVRAITMVALAALSARRRRRGARSRVECHAAGNGPGF